MLIINSNFCILIGCKIGRQAWAVHTIENLEVFELKELINCLNSGGKKVCTKNI